ncbi:MAG TPA: hypothetical protein PLZ07_12565, partial [Syntrophales bacterium]|nr:hypothetical protein [Syntrophales bacterium]
ILCVIFDPSEGQNTMDGTASKRKNLQISSPAGEALKRHGLMSAGGRPGKRGGRAERKNGQ